MDILESIGFTHFWGLSPALNIIDKEYEKDTLNVLLSGTCDPRHILKTLADNLEDPNGIKQINFYIHEKQKEPFARILILLEILHLSHLNYKERIDLYCDIFGNNLIREKSQRFINAFIPQMEKFITGDPKALTILKHLVSLKTIKYKEKDELVDIIRSWNGNIPYEMEKHRDQRIRYILKTRYDYKKNMIDWDYNMGLLKVCPILHYVHYKEWRLTGVAFEAGFSSYIIPNRTMSSYIPGKNKKEYTSCMVRGYWGDIICSPYIAMGVECDYEPLLFKVANKQQCGNSVEVTDFNLEYFLQMIDTQTEYIKEFTDMYREKESRKKKGVIVDPKDIKNQERQEKKDKEEKEKEEKAIKKYGKKTEYREEEVEMIPEEDNEDEEEKEESKKQEKQQEEESKKEQTDEEEERNALDEPIKKNELSKKAQEKEQQLQEDVRDDQSEHSQQSEQSEHSLASTQPEEPKQEQNQTQNQEKQQAQENDLYLEKEHELLSGLSKIKVNILPIFDDLNTMLGKKKWHNFFDIGVVGFTMNGQFANKEFKKLFVDDATIFAEKNMYVVPMKVEDKSKYEQQLIDLAKEGGLKQVDYDKLHHFKFEINNKK